MKLLKMNKISLLAYMALTANAQGPIQVVPVPTDSQFPHSQSAHPVVVHIADWPSEMGYDIKGKSGAAVGVRC
jgi:hypothetical protein